MRKNTKLILIMLSIIALAASIIVPVWADAVSDLKNKKTENAETIRKARDYLADGEAQMGEALAEIVLLDIALDEAAAALELTENELAATVDLLDKTEAELREAEDLRERQYELFKERIRYMYENGSVSYLKVILQAKSVSDLLNRIEYVETIIEYDNNAAKRLAETEALIAAKVADIERDKREIENLKTLQESGALAIYMELFKHFYMK